MQALDFLVDRADLRDARFVESQLDAAPGEVLLAIDRFAFTANNVTYAVAGDSMAYWRFFPAAGGWGRIPVWGFAEVLESRCDGIAPGERVYGYLPMSSHVVVRPERISAGAFVDGSAHRAERAPVYNRYERVAPRARDEDEAHRRAEAMQMLLRPLFGTSFLLDDFLEQNAFFGAQSVILTSASSKTAIGLAFMLRRRSAHGARTIGLTSPRNRTFVEGLGYYDRVVTYDAIEALDAHSACVIIDVAGDGRVLRALHDRLFNVLRHTCLVGATHWEAGGGFGRESLPGPKPELFFAPAHAEKRQREWGRGELDRRLGAASADFTTDAPRWLQVIEGSGEDAVMRVYREVLAGRAPPNVGYVLSLPR